MSQSRRVAILYVVLGVMLILRVVWNSAPLMYSAAAPAPQTAARPIDYTGPPFPVLRLTSIEQWRMIRKSGRYVLFFDGGWDATHHSFHETFAEFGQWCVQNTDYQPLLVIPHDEALMQAVGQLCDEQGYDTRGWNGILVWLDNGNVQELMHYWDLQDGSTMQEHTVEVLQASLFD